MTRRPWRGKGSNLGNPVSAKLPLSISFHNRIRTLRPVAGKAPVPSIETCSPPRIISEANAIKRRSARPHFGSSSSEDINDIEGEPSRQSHTLCAASHSFSPDINRIVLCRLPPVNMLNGVARFVSTELPKTSRPAPHDGDRARLEIPLWQHVRLRPLKVAVPRQEPRLRGGNA